LLLAGLMAQPPWGPLALAVVAAFLAWLVVLSWPRLDQRARMIRVATVGLLVGAIAAGLVDF
jgi:hypothetical protein